MNEDTSRATPGEMKTVYTSTSGSKTTTYTNTNYRTDSRYVLGTGPRVKPFGWLFPTSYDLQQSTVRFPYGKCSKTMNDGLREYSGTLTLAASPLFTMRFNGTSDSLARVNVDMLSQAESRALGQFLTHGKSRDGTFNVGVAWGERQDTAKLLRDAVHKTVGLARALRAGDWRYANGLLPIGSRKDWKDLKDTPYGKWLVQHQRGALKATPAALASGMLEFQNGWKPFMSDVYNAAEALANRNSLADWVITGIGHYKNDQDVDETLKQPLTQFLLKAPSVHRLVSEEKRVKVRLDATVYDQHLHTLAQLGLNNPGAIMWNLARASYVADYYWAIGEWINALGAPAGLRFYSGSRTRFYRLLMQIESADKSTGTFFGMKSVTEMERRPYTGFPVPIPPLSMKPKPLNLSQIFNQLSLLTVWLTGAPRPDLRG